MLSDMALLLSPFRVIYTHAAGDTEPQGPEDNTMTNLEKKAREFRLPMTTTPESLETAFFRTVPFS